MIVVAIVSIFRMPIMLTVESGHCMTSILVRRMGAASNGSMGYYAQNGDNGDKTIHRRYS